MTTTTTRILFVLALGAVASACGKSASGTPDGPVTIAISPTTITLKQGATENFSAAVSHGAATWKVASGDGTVDTTGHYTAPFAKGTYTVTATSVDDPTKSASATVTVVDLVVNIVPAHVRLAPGDTATFTSDVTGSVDPSVTWATTTGAIDSTGHLTAGTVTGAFIVTATSKVNASRSATATVTVTTDPAPEVNIDPLTPDLDQGATQQFTATVLYVTNTDVTWSIAPSTAGTISATGLFTAGTTAGDVDIIATSVEEPTAVGHAVATIHGVSVTVDPASVSLDPGGTQTFTATVTGTNVTGVTWSLGAGGLGSIDAATGHYTASGSAVTDTIIATSVADPTATGTATATVTGAAGFGYTDPTGSSWRLLKNSATTATHLVLDLVGPASTTGRGIAFTLSADQAAVTWTKVAGADDTLVQNHAFTLGSGTQLIKGAIKGNALAVGVFQKGSSDAAATYSGPIVSIALDLKAGGTAASGTSIPITQLKAQTRNAAGTTDDVTIAVGTLVTQ